MKTENVSISFWRLTPPGFISIYLILTDCKYLCKITCHSQFSILEYLIKQIQSEIIPTLCHVMIDDVTEPDTVNRSD